MRVKRQPVSLPYELGRGGGQRGDVRWSWRLFPTCSSPYQWRLRAPKLTYAWSGGGAAPGVLLAAKRDAKQSAEDGRSPYWSPMMGGQRLGAAHHFQVHLPVRSISALSPSVSSAATGLQHHSNGLQRPRRLGIKSPWTHINCMQRAEDEAT